MNLRKMNQRGLDAFKQYLVDLRANTATAVPSELLTDPHFTEPLLKEIEIEIPESFPSRMVFAKWLHLAFRDSGMEVPRGDAGFWSWLSLALFDHICPADANRNRKIKEDARYFPLLESSRRYYRHALVGPFSVYWMYRDRPEQAAAVLCGTLTQLNDEAYRLFVENQLVVMPAAIGVLTRLYYDEKKDRLKPKSRTKNRGSIRRLATYLTRFARTLDLDVVSVTRLMDSLPSEFDPWKPAS